MVAPSPSVKKGIFLSLICLIFLGVMPILSNLRPTQTDALSFAFALSVWQMIFALPIFGLEQKFAKPGLMGSTFAPQGMTRMIIVGLLTGGMFGLSTYLYVLGIEKAGATTAAIAIQAYPLFAILWESLFLKRKKTPVELVLTAILIGTLYYLGTEGSLQITNLSPWFLVALGVPFLWSIAHVIIKEELSRTPITPIQVTFFRVSISAMFLFLVLAMTAPTEIGTALSAVFQVMSAVMGLVYFLELIVWFYAVRHIDVSLASSITTPWPALTMIFAVLFLKETIETYQIAALLVIVSCIYGLTLASLRSPRLAEEK
ncbi:MAG: DMT family transporter [Sneathiella sp.]